MGHGIFKPAGDDEGDGGKAADEVNLSKKLGQVSKLTGNPKDDGKARGLLADIDKIVERGKARRGK